MKIRLLLVGKTDQKEIAQLFNEYENRLSHYCRFEVSTLLIKKNKASKSLENTVEEEGKLILNELDKASYLILLDEKGKGFTSSSFAKEIQKQLLSGKREIVFCIGGAYGFSNAVYERSNGLIALSKMTFTHQMVRLIFIEQLYRAFTILKGEKYHH